MSDFSDRVNGCMSRKGLPPPNLQTVDDAMNLVRQLYAAWERLGRGPQVVVEKALDVMGAAVGEEASEALALAGAFTVKVYIDSLIGCVVATGLLSIPEYVAENPDEEYINQQLAQSASETADTATA